MLTFDEQKSLHILGYLYFRMGLYDKAEKILQSLVIMMENRPYDKNIFALLAAIHILKKNGTMALEFLEKIFDDSVFTGKNAIFYLLKAQALFLEKRIDESKNAFDMYLVHKTK